MNTLTQTSSMVVARFADHRLLKGWTDDFHPEKREFHIHLAQDHDRGTVVAVNDLKGLFFVRSHEGDRSHVLHDDLGAVRGQGRKIEVMFRDGEILRGLTLGYNPAKLGFFVIPADSQSNNVRVFVVNASILRVQWR